MSVDHYENFPVASVLCPPALRPPITAIYHFARTADDIADEGDASTESRLADLAHYRRDLMAVATGQAPSARWARVFAPLAEQIRCHALPVPLLADLLDAFAQDTRNPLYPDRAAHGVPLADLAACRDSAAARGLVRELCAWARDLMHEGAPLTRQVPGRAGWELRLVVQGGLRILEKIAAMDHAALLRRPTVGAADAPLLLWRALLTGAAR